MLLIAHLNSHHADPIFVGIGILRVVVRSLSIIREDIASG
jgi:hypothetical protein